MKFTIQKEIFFFYFKKINGILTKNPLFPILENVILKVNESGLILIGSNLDLEITITIKKSFLKIYNTGITSVSGRKLSNIFRNSPKHENLNFKLINNKVQITMGNSNFKLLCLSPSIFPFFQSSKNKIKFKIPQNKFKDILVTNYISIANNDVRNYLNGMLLKSKEKILSGVSTDSYRMTIFKYKNNLNLPKFSIILNKKCISELIQILEDNDILINIEISENNIIFHIKNIKITSKLIEGNFPNYNDIILKKTEECINVPVKQLKESLLRSSILCNSIFKGVYLCFFKNKLEIISNNQEEEGSEEFFEIQYTGKKIEFSINVFYLLDIIKSIQTHTINFLLNKDIQKIQLQSKEKKEVMYMIMPLRL